MAHIKEKDYRNSDFLQWLNLCEYTVPLEGSKEEEILLEKYYNWLGDQ